MNRKPIYETRSERTVFILAFDDAESIQDELAKGRSRLGKYYRKVIDDVFENETTYEEAVLNYCERVYPYAAQDIYDNVEWRLGYTKASDICTDDNHDYASAVEKRIEHLREELEKVILDKEYIAEVEYDKSYDELRPILTRLKCTVFYYEIN